MEPLFSLSLTLGCNITREKEDSLYTSPITLLEAMGSGNRATVQKQQKKGENTDSFTVPLLFLANPYENKEFEEKLKIFSWKKALNVLK